MIKKLFVIIILLSLASYTNAFNTEDREIYPVTDVIGSSSRLWYPLGSYTNITHKAAQSLFKAVEERYALAFNLTNEPPTIVVPDVVVCRYFAGVSNEPYNSFYNNDEALRLISRTHDNKIRRYIQNTSAYSTVWSPFTEEQTTEFYSSTIWGPGITGTDLANIIINPGNSEASWGLASWGGDIQKYLFGDLSGAEAAQGWHYYSTNGGSTRLEGEIYNGIMRTPYIKILQPPSIINPSIAPAIRLVEELVVPETVYVDGSSDDIALITINQVDSFQLLYESYLDISNSTLKYATVYPVLTENFWATLDYAIYEMTPKFVSTNEYVFDNNGYSNWFNQYNVDILGNTNYPSTYPYCSPAEIMHTLNIGYVTNIVYNDFDFITGGDAYFTRMPKIDNLEYSLYDGIFTSTNNNEFRKLSNYELPNIYYGSYTNIVIDINTTNTNIDTITIYLGGSIIHKPTQTIILTDDPSSDVYVSYNIPVDGISHIPDLIARASSTDNIIYSGDDFTWKNIEYVRIDNPDILPGFSLTTQYRDTSIYIYYDNYELFSNWPAANTVENIDGAEYYTYDWDGVFYQMYIPHIEERVEYLDALRFTTKPWDGWTNHVSMQINYDNYPGEYEIQTNYSASTNIIESDHTTWLTMYTDRFTHTNFSDIYDIANTNPPLFDGTNLVTELDYLNPTNYMDLTYSFTNMVLPNNVAPSYSITVNNYIYNLWEMGWGYGYYNTHDADWTLTNGLISSLPSAQPGGGVTYNVSRIFNTSNINIFITSADAYSRPVARYAQNIGGRLYYRDEEYYVYDDATGLTNYPIVFCRTNTAQTDMIIISNNISIEPSSINISNLVTGTNTFTSASWVSSTPLDSDYSATNFPEVTIDNALIDTEDMFTYNGSVSSNGTNFIVNTIVVSGAVANIYATNFHTTKLGTIPINTNLHAFNGVYYYHTTDYVLSGAFASDLIFPALWTNANGMAIGVETNTYDNVAFGWDMNANISDYFSNWMFIYTGDDNSNLITLDDIIPVSDSWAYSDEGFALHKFPYAETSIYTNYTLTDDFTNATSIISYTNYVRIPYPILSAFSVGGVSEDPLLTDREYFDGYIASDESLFIDFLSGFPKQPIIPYTATNTSTFYGGIKGFWDPAWQPFVPVAEYVDIFDVYSADFSGAYWYNPTHPLHPDFPVSQGDLWIVNIDYPPTQPYYSEYPHEIDFGWYHSGLDNTISSVGGGPAPIITYAGGDPSGLTRYFNNGSFVFYTPNSGLWYIYDGTDIYRSTNSAASITNFYGTHAWDYIAKGTGYGSTPYWSSYTTALTITSDDDITISVVGYLFNGNFHYIGNASIIKLTEDLVTWDTIETTLEAVEVWDGSITTLYYDRFSVDYRYADGMTSLAFGWRRGPQERLEHTETVTLDIWRDRVFPLPILLKWDIDRNNDNEYGLEYRIW